MTAIWDTIGGKARQLTENFDEEQIIKLKTVISELFECIKQEPEYSDLKFYFNGKKDNDVLQVLESAIHTDKWNESVCKWIQEVVSRLHDFDHMNQPFKNKDCYGHHTEKVIIQSKNKKIVKAIKKIYYESWWKGELD